MPKLKVPSTEKPAKKQLTLYDLKRRPLHNSNASETSPGSLKSNQHLGPSPGPGALPLKQQNGLKPISKSFSESFGDSDDEAEPFAGFSLLDVLEEYRILARTCTEVPPDGVMEGTTGSQRPTRESRSRKGRGRYSGFVGADDLYLDSFSTDETPPTSPSNRPSDMEAAKMVIPDNSSDSSWEGDMPAKFSRKSSRMKVPRQFCEDGDAPLRKRGVRCMECPACLQMEDCGKCEMCLDKKKFGGRGVKKQACIYRKCHNLIRDLPLKFKPKRVSLPLENPPSPSLSRRFSTNLPSEYFSEPRPLQASPIKSKRFLLVPDRSSKDKPDAPVVHIHWPEQTDISGIPIYSVRASMTRLSVCRKCGSRGKIEMIRCIVCCHIFHTFCVANSTDIPFTCPSCITCHICGRGKQCVQCTQCRRWFHKDCVTDHQSHHVNGSWRCVKCTKCTSCKTTIPGKVVGGFWYDDFKYCHDCHNLKQKGNFCPVCGECYSDNDYDSKMVQCGKCDHWIHAHCEGMSDEVYEILSILPDTVTFLCKLCGTEEERKEWQSAVEEYLHTSMTKLMSVVIKVSKYCSELLDLEERVTKKELSNVDKFHKTILSLLTGVLKKYKSGAAAHKLAITVQNDYLDELDELFPWVVEEEKESTVEKGRGSEKKVKSEEEAGKGVSGDSMEVSSGEDVVVESGTSEAVEEMISRVPHIPMELKWPSILTHDHCYIGFSRPLQPVAGGNDPDPHTEGDRKHRAKSVYPSVVKLEKDLKDSRRCVLCPVEGDAAHNEAGRLLPCGVDEWIHVNCAIWSAEAYEEHSGILRCVHTAISRGIRMRCDLCKEPGATVGCCTSTCSANYHFQCARKTECLFLFNKQVFCNTHRESGEGEVVLSESDVTVSRCIFVDTNPDRPGRKISRELEVSKAQIQIGTIQVQSLGSLVELSDTPTILLPDKYKASCEYWSVSDPTITTTYTLTISAPEDDDWLMAPPITPPSSPQASPPSDIDHHCITLGEQPLSVWDSLKCPPSKRRKVNSSMGGRKARTKNTDSATDTANLVSLLQSNNTSKTPQRSKGQLDGNHRPVDIHVINNVANVSSVRTNSAIRPEISSLLDKNYPNSLRSTNTSVPYTKSLLTVACDQKDLLPVTTSLSMTMATSAPITSLSTSVVKETERNTANSATTIAMSCSSSVDILQQAMSDTLLSSTPTKNADSVSNLTCDELINAIADSTDVLSPLSKMDATNSSTLCMATSVSNTGVRDLISGGGSQVSSCLGVTSSHGMGGSASKNDALYSSGVVIAASASGEGSSASSISAMETNCLSDVMNAKSLESCGVSPSICNPTLTTASTSLSSLTCLTTSADLSELVNSIKNSTYPSTKIMGTPTPMLSLSPSTLNAISPPITDTSLLTLVPVISNSKLYLCPLPSDHHTLTSEPSISPAVSPASQSLNCFPNASAVKNFKIPKKSSVSTSKSFQRLSRSGSTRSPRSHPRLRPTPSKEPENSEEAVRSSICLKRKRCGLSTVPHSLNFSITTSSGQAWTAHDLRDAWESVLTELEEQRVKLDLPYVPYNRDVYHQFGLTHQLIVQLVEQLPHSNRCSDYTFSYHKPSQVSSWRAHRPAINLSGCSRTEKFNGIRSRRDMFSFLMSAYRPSRPTLDLMALEYAVISAETSGVAKMQSASDLPMAMRYRSLQKTYKQHVSVFQSEIHGLGLYCTKEIEPGEMVIEYAGTVIRSVLTDKREKLYDSKGIGCYMFRIDADEVVDATMSGNEARFINHACEPNCYSKVITVDGNKKIMIFALRRIVPGEELTYDYKFPKEDAKIPCNCGSKRCRKTMN